MQLEEVLDSIPLSIQDILDHGCGQGSWIHLLQDKFLNAKITGIDISKNGIDVTKKLFPKHTFLFFDGETAPLSDSSYDLIFSYHPVYIRMVLVYRWLQLFLLSLIVLYPFC